MKKIQKLNTYRGAVATQSVLTITSNVVYGKKTCKPRMVVALVRCSAPGANPMHGRDQRGAVASRCPLPSCRSPTRKMVSPTPPIVPNALGKTWKPKANLVCLMDGYFHHEANLEGGQHLNVNVMNREMLLDAMENPEKYPQLTTAYPVTPLPQLPHQGATARRHDPYLHSIYVIRFD
ncbi:glycine radical domain-containing protein [Shigella flexneri]